MLEDQEHLLCGGYDGYIDIIDVLKWKVIQSCRLSSCKPIIDIAKLPQANLYAFSL